MNINTRFPVAVVILLLLLASCQKAKKRNVTACAVVSADLHELTTNNTISDSAIMKGIHLLYDSASGECRNVLVPLITDDLFKRAYRKPAGRYRFGQVLPGYDGRSCSERPQS